MKNRLLRGIVFLMVASTASVSTVVASSITIGEYDIDNCFPYSCFVAHTHATVNLTEWQQHFSASAFGFSGPVFIDAFSLFRASDGVSDSGSFDVFLSYAANPLGSDSTDLASNVGAHNTLFATISTGPTVPAILTVTGNSPFLYDPLNGDLIIDVVTLGFTSIGQGQNGYFKADFTGSDTQRNFSQLFGGNTANGLGGLVTEFSYTEDASSVPEPSSLLLLTSGLLALVGAAKRNLRNLPS